MAGIVALAVFAVGAFSTHWLRAQVPTAQSPATPAAQTLGEMESAGIKMSFDVASVKLNTSGGSARSNVLGPGAAFPTGGLFSATNFRLQSYLTWAYDLPGYEALRLLGQYPAWAITDHFDIEARAQGNPTKAQMQLMMQSLLADRFKLKVHHETKEGPAYALVLSKPGKTGPQLQPHLNDASCTTPAAPPAQATAGIPDPCASGITGMPITVPGRLDLRGRNVTMERIAEFLPAIGGSGVDRPVLDRTGLSGAFDFTIQFAAGELPQGLGGPPPNSEPDATGRTFFEALQDQLGLKLESTKGPVDVLVIDHVEEPSPN
jgi:uncharacterized protein (TIGR03435 family)